MVVPFGGAAGGEGGFGEGLVLDGGVCEVEQAANGGAVFGGEWGLSGEGANDHRWQNWRESGVVARGWRWEKRGAFMG